MSNVRRATLTQHSKLGPELPDHEADSIDYCYLRPSYLPAANGLLRMLFWPGIDSACLFFIRRRDSSMIVPKVSEWLDLPELSIVVLYRRLVIGCAVVSTEGYISYIAVHPQWRGCGIGRYMLYHLIMVRWLAIKRCCHSSDFSLGLP